MAQIKFKTKLKSMYIVGGTFDYDYVQVPEFKRSHCDMQAFRSHSKYGAYANSDLFLGMLSHIRKNTFKNGILKMNEIPDGVHVDTSGFFVSVSFDV